MQAYIDGEFIPEEKAVVSIFDRSYLYGEGVFETVRAYRGRPAFAKQHCWRLKANCDALKISLPFREEEFEELLIKVLKKNHIGEGAIRVTVSTVGASFGVQRPAKIPSCISIFCRPVEMSENLFEKGAKVIMAKNLVNESYPAASVKSTSYLTKMLARLQAHEAGAYEALLKNPQGYFVEGSRTNLFLVISDMVVTAPLSDGLLPGITREIVLEILKSTKRPWREDHITEGKLKEASEIFLTGSTTEVLGVKEIVGVTEETPCPGLVTKELHRAYLNLALAI